MTASRRLKHYESLVTLLVVVTLIGCAAQSPAPDQPWIRSELYFGLTKPDGAAVTDAEWQSFLDTAVTPRFPDGLTVVQAHGRYRSTDQTLHEEPTGILIILHPDTPRDNDNINALCRDYVRRFSQESVLRSDTPARTTFLTATAKSAPAESAHKLSR